jgi:hypothetical protein
MRDVLAEMSTDWLVFFEPSAAIRVDCDVFCELAVASLVETVALWAVTVLVNADTCVLSDVARDALVPVPADTMALSTTLAPSLDAMP